MEDLAHPGGVFGPHAAALRAALLQPFLRLNFVTLWVRDQERSRRFFVEKMNFEAIVDLPTPDGSRWIVVAPLAAGWLPGTAGACLGSPSLNANWLPATPSCFTPTVLRKLNAEGEEFGEERLLEAARQHRELSPPELLAAVADQVRGFSPHEQADDITLIVATCT